MAEKSKRRIADYAGLAALVTAIGAVTFGVIDRTGHEDKADRMSRSIFNVSRERIAVLEYRIAELEELCQTPTPPPAAAPAPARRPTIRRADVLATAAVEVEADDELEDTTPEAAPVRSAAEVSFDQIQRIVDGGETYEGES